MDNKPKAKVAFLHGRQEMKLPYPGNVAFQSCWLTVPWVGGSDTCKIFLLAVPMPFLVLILKFNIFSPEFGANQIPNVVLDIWHLMFQNSIGSLGCWQLQTKLEWLSIPFSRAGGLHASSSAAPTVHTEPPGSSAPLQRTAWVLCLAWYGLGKMCMLKICYEIVKRVIALHWKERLFEAALQLR